VLPVLCGAGSDTLSFRRFAGLGMQDGTPDHLTISRFHKVLSDAGLDAGLFDEIARQLETRGA
jgi:transposase, IS5 family